MVSMLNTAFESSSQPRYDFSFAWESSYGHLVELVKRLGPHRGLMIDLGCGVGAIAPPLIELGYDYIGADIDPVALDELSKRGLEGRELDLCRIDDLAKGMLALADGHQVAAVLLIDVLEHIPATRPFLAAIRDGLELLGRPPLFVSVPNVAHVDLAAKLAFGKWDYTLTGLLDSTHTQFFTSERLQTEARACGLLELGANDFAMRSSDQHFPSDHPALAWSSPVAQAFRNWRAAADPHGETNQFIRAFAPCDLEPLQTPERPGHAASSAPLAVVMRTQGKYVAALRDALTCLAAQTLDSFEVLLMVHSDAASPVLDDVQALVAEFNPIFSRRVRVIHVSGGRRARPLNVALERLKADYVAFLDDDDLVTADWVESFIAAAGDGAIIRSVTAVREVSTPSDAKCQPFIVESPLQFRYKLDFDRLRHYHENETPICAFAIPRRLIEVCRLAFDEDLPVLEDWDFLLRCVAFAPVRDTRKLTSIYQLRQSGDSSASLHKADVWRATQRMLQDRMNMRPLTLPIGSTDQLVATYERLAELDATLAATMDQAHSLQAEVAALRVAAHRQQQAENEASDLAVEFDKLQRAYHITINSRRWRVLGPPAQIIARVRRAMMLIQSRSTSRRQ